MTGHPVIFVLMPAFQSAPTGLIFTTYLPRRKEINAPNPPIKPRPKIKSPIGTRPVSNGSSLKVAITNGAGGVKVGKRVEVTGAMKAAASVGSMVGVEANVGVAGATILGSFPFFAIRT